MAQQRRARVSDFKRGLIREAARDVFARRGIEAASMRAIAAQAGCTTGAIYVHYATKEELYAELLGESLDALLEVLAAARDGAPKGRRGRAVLRAMLDFYRRRPQDFDLSFYLHGGAPRRAGLSRELDRGLNARMAEIVDLVGDAIVADGGGPAGRRRHLGTAASASVFGVVLMLRTGRLDVLGETPDAVLETLVP